MEAGFGIWKLTGQLTPELLHVPPEPESGGRRTGKDNEAMRALASKRQSMEEPGPATSARERCGPQLPGLMRALAPAC